MPNARSRLAKRRRSRNHPERAALLQVSQLGMVVPDTGTTRFVTGSRVRQQIREKEEPRIGGSFGTLGTA